MDQFYHIKSHYVKSITNAKTRPIREEKFAKPCHLRSLKEKSIREKRQKNKEKIEKSEEKIIKRTLIKVHIQHVKYKRRVRSTK
jgi:hypothetical protein